MKKIVPLFLVLFLFIGVAQASSIDFTTYSLVELSELQTKLTQAMWASKEWQEVEVPAGVYKIGEDIPAGKWTISSNSFFMILLGDKLDVTKTTVEIEIDTIVDLIDPKDYTNGYTVELTEGRYIILNSWVIFTPAVSKPLNFK